MSFPVRSKGRRGWSFAVIPAKAGIQNRGARRRRRQPGEGQPQGVVPTPRAIAGPANGAHECGPSSGPPHNSGTARFEGRQSKPRIPAFAGMTAGDAPYGGERGFHGFVGAVREPPVLAAWARPPAIVRLVGAGGSFTNDPYGTFAPRWNENPGKDNPRGLSLHSRRARPQSPSFRRRPESGTGARGGERAFPANPCAGSWFRRGGARAGLVAAEDSGMRAAREPPLRGWLSMNEGP